MGISDGRKNEKFSLPFIASRRLFESTITMDDFENEIYVVIP